MSATKRKQYLFDKDVPLTKYALSEINKILKREKLLNNESLSCSSRNISDQSNPHVLLDETDNDLLSLALDESVSANQNPIASEQQLLINNDTVFDWSDLLSDDEELQLPSCKKSTSNSIRELINNEEFFNVLSLNVQKSQADILLMLLKFSVANTLSMTGISNLFKLIDVVCGRAVVPETRYKIDKLFDDDIITLHGVCPACTNYIGTFQDFNYVVNCANCDKPVNMSNPSSQCYFAMFDPSNAIQDYIETNENYYDYVVKEREHKKNHIKDIYDGVLYRKFVQSLKDSDRHSYATVIFNTDGAPVFESSTYSIWPIYLILNEIPIQSRMKSAITAGLWFGKDKPIMSVFLDAFVNMINDLSTVGIPCMIKNEQRNLKVFALVATVDTVARAPMKGSSQFNARYGCDWCTHEGQYFQGSMRYPFRIPLPKNRDHDTTIKHAAEAVKTGKRVFGIVTASPLLNLKKFDIIEGFTPDYMHCYVAGVAKQITTYILRHLRKADIQYMNQLLEAIRAPHQIGRLTRSLKNRKYWKAREYENWLLYYSIPVLSAVFDNTRILKHWALLVDALHICLGTNITYTELNRANEMLHEFVSKAEDLYSLTSLTYNVHQLLHLPTSVYNWGPVYSHSTYPFESANCKLLQAIHCAKGVILQIARYDKIQRAIQMLSNSIYPTCHESVVQYCENVKTPLAKNIYKITSINYLGKGKSANNDTLEKFGISKDARVFHKIIYKGCLFMTSKKKNARSCNYFAQLDTGEYVEIKYFLVNDKSNQELTICQLIKTKPNKYSSFVREVLEFSNELCIDTTKISATCVFIEIKTKMYIIAVPNQLFY